MVCREYLWGAGTEAEAGGVHASISQNIACSPASAGPAAGILQWTCIAPAGHKNERNWAFS